MTPEEARKFQDEWLAAQPKWPQHPEDPIVTLANEAYAELPAHVKERLLKENLARTASERVERWQERLNRLFANADRCRTKEDVTKLLYPDL
jgi:hypothetical protein